MATQITQTNTVEAKFRTGTLARERHWRVGFFTVLPGAVFQPAPIPLYLYMHGIVMTTWFALTFVQALLISAGKIANHRRFGAVLACFAIAVVIAALTASFGSISRRHEDLNAPAAVVGNGIKGMTVAQFHSGVVWGNNFNVLSFAIFVGLAVIYRRRPQIHKRLMLLASISVLEPALARMARWPGFGGEQGPFIPIVIWSLITSLVIYDLVTRKHLEKVTAIAFVWLLITRNGAVLISRTHFGLSFIYWLGKLRG
jgi:uncharacterized membrane protein YozB (DUF420 family)